MENRKPNIALLSPSVDSYSETFIRAHKELLNANTFHYHGGDLPTKLDGNKIINSRKKRILDIIKGHYRLNQFSLEEQAIITSFKQNNIELVFAEYGGTGERILSVCKELCLPLIVHFHGYDASSYDQLEINEKYKGIFQYASYIVCVSRKMEFDLLGMGCPAHKLVYTVCGPRDEFFEVKPIFEKQQFIAIGRFVDKKAPYYLILSFLEVIKEFPDSRLIIIGNGELFNSCKNLVAYFGLDSQVELPGVVSPERCRGYLKESLAFVQHSIITIGGDTEGTPVAVLEASAAGLPVVSTRHAGIADVVTDGETGLLCEEHNLPAFIENMKSLLRHTGNAKRMGEKGKKNIRDNFSLNKHIKILDELISKCIS